MSQFTLTANERVVGLQRFGYSEREAQFLSTVALHSGYFLRRQFGQFLGKESDSATESLVGKMFDNCHANAIAFDRDMHLYHLCARSLYAALGEEHNRNRRRRECSTMKNKVMGLDFILAHPGAAFLATEQEKIRYFTSVHGIAQSKLPAKIYGPEEGAKVARYFVEKYPIFFLPDGPVSFCFVDEGQTTPSHFKTFLASYSDLFSSLPEFHLVYVAAKPTPFKSAQKTFGHYPAKANRTATFPSDLKRLTSYFTLRQQYETKDVEALDRAKLIQLRNDQITFSGPECDQLFLIWKAGGEMAIRQHLAPESARQTNQRASFSTHLLEHNYDFFGSLTSL